MTDEQVAIQAMAQQRNQAMDQIVMIQIELNKRVGQLKIALEALKEADPAKFKELKFDELKV